MIYNIQIINIYQKINYIFSYQLLHKTMFTANNTEWGRLILFVYAEWRQLA